MNLLKYNLGPSVYAFSTTREGGVSKENYSTFSICDYCGDKQEHIITNRKILCQHLKIPNTHLIAPHQSHSINIETISRENLDQAHHIANVDALITNLKQVCIGVSTADCVPLLLYDPCTSCVAAVHAGWRGTVNHIIGLTIYKMTQAFNSCPKNIHVVIGPSISEYAFEVGDEVYEAFNKAGFNMSNIANRYPTSDHKTKWHINLQNANIETLTQIGVPYKNIYNSKICTYTYHNKFFSARRLGIQSGRIFSGIMLI